MTVDASYDIEAEGNGATQQSLGTAAARNLAGSHFLPMNFAFSGGCFTSKLALTVEQFETNSRKFMFAFAKISLASLHFRIASRGVSATIRTLSE
jgi:hypothetical protein